MFNPERKSYAQLIADAQAKAMSLLQERTNRESGDHPDERVPSEIWNHQLCMQRLQAMLRGTNQGYLDAIAANNAKILEADAALKLLDVEYRVALHMPPLPVSSE